MEGVMKSSVLTVLLPLILFASYAYAKELDTATFNMKARVVSWKSEEVVTGSHTNTNPNCANPQNSFDKAYCAAAGTNTSTRTRNESHLTVLIGNIQYGVSGKTKLLPGEYQVRIVPGKRKAMMMEFLTTDKNGKPKAEPFEIVEVTQLESK
jgi:hypothetical protein